MLNFIFVYLLVCFVAYWPTMLLLFSHMDNDPEFVTDWELLFYIGMFSFASFLLVPCLYIIGLVCWIRAIVNAVFEKWACRKGYSQR